MTWLPAPTWRVHYDEHTRALELRDPVGTLRARLDPYPLTTPPASGHLHNLQRRLEEGSEPVVWELGHGRLADGESAAVQLPDGPAGTVTNGRAKGWRRVHRNGQIHLPGHRYDVTHRGRRRTRLSRDGVEVLTARRPLLRIGRGKADGPVREKVQTNQPLDPVDELALALLLSVLGPAGRPGWWARLWDELSF